MKIVLVGDTEVGKTCVLMRLIKKEFQQDSEPTIGAAFQNYYMKVEDGETVQLQIWDTAGQEQYKSLAPMYYRAANVAIIFFDLTNIESYKSLPSWIQELSQKAPAQVNMVICGNKKDLENRCISFSEAKKFAMDNGAISYRETSAKTGEGVIEMFSEIAQLDDHFLSQHKERPIQTSGKKKCC